MMQKKEFSLREIAQLTGSRLIGDPEKKISYVADLEHASSTDASFLGNMRYGKAMEGSNAGVIFISDAPSASSDKNFLIHEQPSVAFQKLVELFYSEKQKLTGFEGIHETAVIHKTAKIGKNVEIGPLCVIDENVCIGDNTKIAAGCFIGLSSVIGSNCLFHPRVTIREYCVIGNRVEIQPGAIIGSCGFGFTTDKKGHHTKLKQLGTVIIEDDVEIGANTTIDRARFSSTKIGCGTKIDNLVQIAHGVTVGKHTIIVSQCGIAGSATIGDHVIMGGQVGMNGHISICDGALIAAKSGVTKSITKQGKYGGHIAMPLNEFNRNHLLAMKLESLIKGIKEEIKDLKTRL